MTTVCWSEIGGVGGSPRSPWVMGHLWRLSWCCLEEAWWLLQEGPALDQGIGWWKTTVKRVRNPGFFHLRSGGEKHINDPSSIGLLQKATKYENTTAYEKYCEAALTSIKDFTSGVSRRLFS